VWAVAPPPRDHTVQLEVAAADHVSRIATQLQHEAVLREPLAFLFLARLTGLDRALRAGTYELPPGLWAWEVLDILHRGQVQTVRITVPEGLTLKETAVLFAAHGVVSMADFLAAAHDPSLLRPFKIAAADAEGFLFPETYTVTPGSPARTVVEAMLEQFFAHLALISSGPELSPQELYDRVTLASLVERETRDHREMPRVAGVFENRLKKGMRLESCASVQYLLGKPKERLQLEDVRIPSPYNTYLHPGLPPGPIASPGVAALSAALSPEPHDYLFFFALEDGSHRHRFSRSYSEHLKARRDQLRHP
jgi:UPF0755 protein